MTHASNPAPFHFATVLGRADDSVKLLNLPKLSDLRSLKGEAGGRKARPYGNVPTRWVGAGFIPALRESTFAVAPVKRSLILGLTKKGCYDHKQRGLF
jgi:hypothetical protein